MKQLFRKLAPRLGPYDLVELQLLSWDLPAPIQRHARLHLRARAPGLRHTEYFGIEFFTFGDSLYALSEPRYPRLAYRHFRPRSLRCGL